MVLLSALYQRPNTDGVRTSMAYSMRLEYRMRINLLIVVKKTKLRWYAGEVDMVEDKDIRFHTGSSHLSKQASNSTAWSGMKVFIIMVW